LLETWLGALQIISQQTITAPRLAAIVAAGIGFDAVSVVTGLAEMHHAVAAALKLAAFITAIAFIDVAIVALLIVVNDAVTTKGFGGATAVSFCVANVTIELDTDKVGHAIGVATARRRGRNKLPRASSKGPDQHDKKPEFSQIAPNRPMRR
jgi:hypothetical protein